MGCPAGRRPILCLANYKTTANATVTLTGHTDTVGSQELNMALSQHRADAVRNALVHEGVPAAAITAGGHSEASLPVQTADNVNERRNRSVDITVVGQMARTGMTDAEYCAALSRTYRNFRPNQADETAAATASVALLTIASRGGWLRDQPPGEAEPRELGSSFVVPPSSPHLANQAAPRPVICRPHSTSGPRHRSA